MTAKEPFQFTTESWRKPLPLTVKKNWLPPAVPLPGKSDATEGAGGQVPQERLVHNPINPIANPTQTDALGILAKGACGTSGREAGCGRENAKIGRTSGASQLVRQTTNIIRPVQIHCTRITKPHQLP